MTVFCRLPKNRKIPFSLCVLFLVASLARYVLNFRIFHSLDVHGLFLRGQDVVPDASLIFANLLDLPIGVLLLHLVPRIVREDHKRAERRLWGLRGACGGRVVQGALLRGGFPGDVGEIGVVD